MQALDNYTVRPELVEGWFDKLTMNGKSSLGICYNFDMTNIQEIKSAIGSLPHPEYIKLLGWIHNKDWSEWDAQFEVDIESGKLDFLAKEALEEKKNKTLRKL